MQLDLNDPNSVLWLQQALARVLAGHVYINPTGVFDAATRKAIINFQIEHQLSRTNEPDAMTVARIEQELAVLDSQPIKKKQFPPPPPIKPGDRVG